MPTKLLERNSARRVTIIAYYFPPDEVIGAVRPGNWAVWLAETADVTVIAGPRGKDTDSKVGPYRVVRPRATLLALLEKFANRRRKSDPSGRLLTASTSRKRTGVFRYRMPCLHDLWFFGALTLLFKSKPDVIIATHSPYVSLVAGLAYKLMFPATKLIIDFRDLWVGNPKNAGWFGFRYLEKCIESLVIKKSECCITVSETLRARIARRCGEKKAFLVYNSAAASERSCVSEKPRCVDQRFSLVFTGTIYGEYDLSEFLKALAEWHANRLCSPSDLVLRVASRDTRGFVSQVKAAGLASYLEDCGHVSRAAARRMQEDASVLMLLESVNAGHEGTLTGKVFEYLVTSKPILLLGPDSSSEIYQLISRHRRLMTLSDVKSCIQKRSTTVGLTPVHYGEVARAQLIGVMREIGGDA